VGLHPCGRAPRHSADLFAAVAFVVATFVEMACCRWIDGHWDAWEAKAGTKIKAKIDRWRQGRIKGKIVEWVSSGSALWYSVAAVLARPTVVTTVARLVTGRPVGRQRVIPSCVAYGAWVAVVVGLVGFGLGEAKDAI
jgi:hypothetical protein